MRTELARKQTGADNVNRGAELAAYFTHAKLQPMHQVGALQWLTSSFSVKVTICHLLQKSAVTRVCCPV